MLPDFKTRLFSKSLKTAADLSVFAEKFDTEPQSHKTTTGNLQHRSCSLYNYKIDKQRETSRSSIAINVKYDWSVA